MQYSGGSMTPAWSFSSALSQNNMAKPALPVMEPFSCDGIMNSHFTEHETKQLDTEQN